MLLARARAGSLCRECRESLGPNHAHDKTLGSRVRGNDEDQAIAEACESPNR